MVALFGLLKAGITFFIYAVLKISLSFLSGMIVRTVYSVEMQTSLDVNLKVISR